MMGGYLGAAGTQANIAGNVVAGELGSGAVLSGNIASGAVGRFHMASGQLAGFELGSGSIVSGRIASGQVGNFHVASGQIQGLAGVGVPNVASGTLNAFNLGSGAVVSGTLASGSVGRYHLEGGAVIEPFQCGQDVSGVIAVALDSGGCTVVPAERQSGLRLPAFGVVAGMHLSGAVALVVTRGVVAVPNSGTVASGFPGRPLYVGSGGLLINQSGFMAGASSGHGAAPTAAGSGHSGALVQAVAIALSGTIYVNPGEARSGLISGLLGQY